MELWLTVNGKRTCASAPLDPLTRAVVISLFTWRRAEPDDNADVPMGWWGDINKSSGYRVATSCT
ncbi:bacteriophage V tail protein [Escherichia coli]|nr:bacteriophage V tail protein [Escherichia coli]HDU5746877.1 phage GP46 family protein [Escherichia coli]HDU6411867.1 phage GP46 family protein [Escherichia coli]HDU6749565.1 phage GP46 family protein [Escherichia coli]